MEGLEAHPVLLYDGDCRFCAEQAERLRRWAGGGVELESFRAPGVLARHPQVSAGAAAVAHLLGLRPLLRPLARLYAVPGLHALADAVYRLVAKNRFRLGGRTCREGTCAAHGRR